MNKARYRQYDGPARWAASAFLLLILGHDLRSLLGHTGADFQTFLDGARSFSGSPFSMYNAQVMDTMLGFLYPPPAILLFIPFLSFDIHIGYLLFVAIIMLAAGLSLMFWLRMVGFCIPVPSLGGVGWRIVWIAAGLASCPVIENAWDGQVNTIVLGLCVAYVALIMKGRSALAGAMLALGFWLKLYPVLLLVHGVRYGHLKSVLFGFFATALLLPVLASPMVPWGLYSRYFGTTLPALSGHLMVHISNQSADAFLTRLSVSANESLFTYHRYAIAPEFRFGVFVIAGMAVAAMLLVAGRTQRDSLTLAASLIAMIAPMAPLGWGHTYIYSLPLIYLVLITAFQEQAWGSLVSASGATLVTMIPTQHVFGSISRLPWFVQNCVYSRDLFMTCILLGIAWHLRAGRAGRGAEAGGLLPAWTAHPAGEVGPRIEGGVV